MKVLRIVFCILACLSVAAVVPVAVFFDLYCLIPIAGALFFGSAMFLVIHISRPRVERPDFMNSAARNAEIRAKSDENHENKEE